MVIAVHLEEIFFLKLDNNHHKPFTKFSVLEKLHDNNRMRKYLTICR